MTNPPQFHRAGVGILITDDGEFTAVNHDGTWRVEKKNGDVIARAWTYKYLLEVFAKWWETNGYDKREKEWGRW